MVGRNSRNPPTPTSSLHAFLSCPGMGQRTASQFTRPTDHYKPDASDLKIVFEMFAGTQCLVSEVEGRMGGKHTISGERARVSIEVVSRT